jgi:hypothetical protein
MTGEPEPAPRASTVAPVFEVDGRPAPAPRAPPRDALREVYEELLAIERQRLQVAVRIERERGFVFPETTVIVRDVRFLAEKVYGAAPSGPGRERAGEEAPPLAPPTGAGERAGELDSLLDGLAGEDGELDALLGELGAP